MANGPDQEIPISIEDAEKLHGIVAKHGRLPSGELRFRLRKNDGTAYIRTEVVLDGWQESHFHSRVTETYIVQEGVVFFAFLKEGALKIERHQPGDVFSTKKTVIHTLYVEKGSVLHTVKHGDASGMDRQTDERTKAFDRELVLLTRADLLKLSLQNSQSAYGEEYRHFDVMIWQVPAWSSAIFALSAPIILSMNESTLGFMEKVTRIRANFLIAGIFLTLGFALASFGWILYRFRSHQAQFRRRPVTGWRSAQTISQALINFESGVMIFLCLASLGLYPLGSLALSSIISCALFLYEDKSIKARQSA